MIQPYEYNEVKQEIAQLINIYKTVSDKQVIATSQAQCTLKIKNMLEKSVYQCIYDEYMDVHLTNARAVNLYEIIKESIDPFPSISSKQIEKSFKKVKKLMYPKLKTYDLKETTYLAWDDAGTQRKYIIFYCEGKLVGLYGVMAPQVIKNACSICNTIGNVSMFLTTTKRSGDGTYTKKGNYVCKDSISCNHKMKEKKHLYEFYETLSQ